MEKGKDSGVRSTENRDGDSRQTAQLEHRSYRLHEKLPRRSREREYQEARGDFMQVQLFNSVSKHVCGFLNSQVEGRLFFGVTNQCEVIGVDNQYKARDRETIVRALSQMQPKLSKQDYDLSYCDILNEDGNKIDHLSLVELTVFRKDNLKTLYETNQRQYWQRDGETTKVLSPHKWLLQRTSQLETETRSMLAKKDGLEAQLSTLNYELEDYKKENKELKQLMEEKDSQQLERISRYKIEQQNLLSMLATKDDLEAQLKTLNDEYEILKEKNKELKELIEAKDSHQSESTSRYEMEKQNDDLGDQLKNNDEHQDLKEGNKELQGINEEQNSQQSDKTSHNKKETEKLCSVLTSKDDPDKLKEFQMSSEEARISVHPDAKKKTSSEKSSLCIIF